MSEDKETGKINFGYGELNKLQPSKVYTEYDPSSTLPVDVLKNGCDKQFSINTLASPGGFRAICLQVTKPKEDNGAGSWLRQVLGNAPPLIEVKARIPEIHSCIPNPFAHKGNVTILDQNLVDMHPTFYAVKHDLEEPAVGDIVNVDFGDRINMKDPKFYGKVFSSALVYALDQSTGKSSFQNSNAGGKLLPNTNSKVPAMRAGPPAQGTCTQNNGYGPFCAWSGGRLLGEKDMVKIGGWSSYAGRPHVLDKEAAKAFKEMKLSAEISGHTVKVNSGFRSMQHQTDLYRKYLQRGSPLTAKPGRSNHQNGIALDLAGTNDGTEKGQREGTTPFYRWLAHNAHKFGFVRTVDSESWHWVYKGKSAAASYRVRKHRRYGPLGRA